MSQSKSSISLWLSVWRGQETRDRAPSQARAADLTFVPARRFHLVGVKPVA